MNKALRLRELMAEPGIIVAPGCYDGLSARMVAKAGFDVVYMTGYGTAASVLGMADYGFITMVEMATHAKNIANAVNIPLIADADTGYGNPLNVIRTVHEYERAGVAAMHLEDQVFPKRCGHMEGKQVVPLAEHAAKIRAAADARKDMLIIARTDARAPLGLEAAIERGIAYHEAGADIIFVDAPQSVEELQTIAEKIKAPLFVNMTEGGKTPLLTVKELGDLGYKIVIFPISGLLSALKAMEKTLEVLKRTGSTRDVLNQMSFPELNEIIGLSKVQEIEKKYMPK